MNQIDKTYIGPNVELDTSMLNIKIVPVRYLNTNSILEAQFIKKLSNTETELRKDVAYKKRVSLILKLSQFRIYHQRRQSQKLSSRKLATLSKTDSSTGVFL